MELVIWIICLALVVYNFKQFVDKKGSSNYTEQMRRQTPGDSLDSNPLRKRKRIKITELDEKKLEDLFKNSPDISPEQRKKIKETTIKIKQISKLAPLIMFGIIAYNIIGVKKIKYTKKEIPKHKVQHTRNKVKSQNSTNINQNKALIVCAAGTCPVRHIVWKDSSGCFQGTKIYEETACKNWACSPLGSGNPRKGNECREMQNSRFRYLDFDIPYEVQ